MSLSDVVRLNEFGFFEVIDKPTPAELSEYYARRYYQEGLSTYQAEYSPEDLEHIEGKLRLRHWIVDQLRSTKTSAPAAFLDIGCGEGWAMAYFRRLGWEVVGLDYSSFSIERFNPGLREQLRVGDLAQQLDAMRSDNVRFEAIWLDNVLEHVPDPAALLRQARSLVTPVGVLVVEVPNDFSMLQNHLLATGRVDHPFWVALPDHLSYFNKDGLCRLAVETGWRVAEVIADQPIDLNLLNPATNYVADRAAGPAAHQARIEQDNLILRSAPLEAVFAYSRGLAGVGLGRNLVAFLQPDREPETP